MKTNNKGFTLTELLVSVVIFGVVLVAAFGFMLASAKSYNKVNDRLEIQTRSQMALNLIEEYVIDSIGGICFEDNTLYILREPTTENVAGKQKTTCVADVFRFSEEDNVLRYAKASAEKTGETEYRFTLPDESEFYEVTKDVIDFKVKPKENESKLNTISAIVTLEMKNRLAEYEGSINIALRNKPSQVTISILSA